MGGSAIRDASHDALFEEAAELYGSALDRLARAYELDPDGRRDLLQEIHLQLWRSFAQYDRRCSLRTWVYRVAHNTATKHVVRQKRLRSGLVSLEEIDALPTEDRTEQAASRALELERLDRLIRRLKPLDRQIIVSWLEGMDAASISEITGLQPANVAMKIHRIKQILKRGFDQGGFDAE